MLKGVILYYSNTGNTRIACQHIKSRITHADFELIDIMRTGCASLAPYSVAGFAFFTDSWRPPALYLQKVRTLADVSGKPAFSFNTFGCISGKSSRIMTDTLSGLGMTVIGAHSLHTPENFPPMIAAERSYANSPNDKEMADFDAFIRTLDQQLSMLDAGQPAVPARAKLGMLNSILPANAQKLMELVYGKSQMSIDDARCIACGKCAKLCPAAAITMGSAAVIDTAKCTQCWCCYNHCPSKAVCNGKLAGQAQYPHPPEDYRRKFSAPADAAPR